jgi:hypothetical protein
MRESVARGPRHDHYQEDRTIPIRQDYVDWLEPGFLKNIPRGRKSVRVGDISPQTYIRVLKGVNWLQTGII